MTASNVRLYVNGTQVASTAHTGAISTSTNQLQIGGDSLYGQYFAGMIDEVRLYNTALTAAQIQTDMTTPITPTGPDTQPPTQPTGLTANAISGARSTCPGPARPTTSASPTTWSNAASARAAPSPRSAPPATAPRTTYKDTTVAAGTGYSYRVRATDAATNLSPYSNTATATTPAPDTQPPTQPTGLTANAISGGEVDLSWTGSTDNVGVTDYLVERCLSSSCTFAQIGTTGNGTTHHLQGHHRRRRHRLQLPRPRHRRRQQPQPLLQHRHRHHPGAGHAAADAADRR